MGMTYSGCTGGGGCPTGPANVTDFLATPAVGGTAIDLAWTDSADEVYIQIEISLDQATWTQLAFLAQDTVAYQADGLIPETQYFFRIRTLDQQETNSDWLETTATTLALPLPPAENDVIGFWDFSDESGSVITSGANLTSIESPGGS